LAESALAAQLPNARADERLGHLPSLPMLRRRG
jgi:hypothetical protein